MYDALVGINVPSDKARAVVDAMERDMGGVLATKVDLEHRYLLLKQEIAASAALTSHEIAALEQRLGARIERLDARVDQVEERLGARIDQVEQRLGARIDQVDARMELLRSSMTVRLGSMLFVSTGLLFAALRLT
jgi:tetrahydromethanopterin S-methyltransferase subunit G